MVATKGFDQISSIAHFCGNHNRVIEMEQKNSTKNLQPRIFSHHPTITIFQIVTELFQLPQKGGCHMFLEKFHREPSRGSQKKHVVGPPFLVTKKTLVTIQKIVMVR